MMCTTCKLNYVPNYKGVCVQNKFLTGCAKAYNATQCLACTAGTHIKLRNPNNDESEFIGNCVEVTKVPVQNCLYATSDGTFCLRCLFGYALSAGYCISVGSDFPN